mmetsp:Transcript_237/g.327  ORF Transcript_237/g.327 Transcript_237/m.327 type:complete len:316 (-) Transcript_237:120-1067(-)
MNWKLTNKAGGQVPNSELGGKVVALYFSAHWCPPCRGFTPKLKQFYEEVNGSGSNFQIVFVSSDKSEAEARDYFTNDHGDWLMVDSAQKGPLSEKYGVRGIPSLIVIDSAGTSIAPDARGQVAGAASADDMKAVLEEWAKHCSDWRKTSGTSLGGNYVAGSQEAMRAARLARLGGGPPPPVQERSTPSADPAPSPAAATVPVTAVAPAAVTAPAPEPAAIASAGADAVTQLTAMGFGADQARQALDATGGDIEAAATMLAGADDPMLAPTTTAVGDDSEAISTLTAMGFDAAQARHALEAAGGNIEAASAILLGD